MRQINTVGVFILLLSLFACGQPKNKGECKDPYAKYATYATTSYSIKYPKNWRLDTSGYMGTDFSIFSAQTSLLDKFIENVNLVTYNLSGPDLDLKQFVKQSEEKITSVALDSSIVESERLSANGKEFQKLVYKQRKSIFIVKHVQYYWIDNKKAYVLTFACKSNEYNVYKERGENILNSFKLN